jgi:hypothetical protein
MQYGHTVKKAEYDVDFESVEKDSRERVNSKKVIEKWSFFTFITVAKVFALKILLAELFCIFFNGLEFGI